MIKKLLGCAATTSLMALAACGGSIQDIGDAAAGGGGSGSAEPRGGTSAQPQAGTSAQPRGGSGSAGSNPVTHRGGSASGSAPDGRGGAAWGPGTCDPPCSEGYGCYTMADDPAGLCAPLCDRPDQGQTPDEDLSCSNSVQGGPGQCVFSIGFGWPLPGGQPNPTNDSDRFVTGLCSNACDPIAQDCPAGYTCDMTDTYSAVAQQGLYACLPNKLPHALGEKCQSTGEGECGPGSTCTLGTQGVANGSCTAFCDLRDADACPEGQTCTETEVTMQDNDPNIGVCL